MAKKKEEKVVDAVIDEAKSKTKKTSKVTKEKPKVEKVQVEKIVTKNSEPDDKPYFFPRLIAYIIDILIVSMCSTLIMFVIPNNNEEYNKHMEEYEKIQAEAINDEINAKELLDLTKDVVYDIDHSNILSLVMEVVLIVLYFVGFQFYNKGQTFGKKLMRLRVVSVKDEPLTIKQLIYRGLILNGVLINICIIAAVLFVGRNYYYYVSYSLQVISMLIIFTILMMIMFRKDGRGLHDVVAGTRVIQES